jgi:hypothetical protein
MTEAPMFGNYLEIEGACKTSATGPVIAVSTGFPWPFEITTKGTATLKGSKKIVTTYTFLALEGPNNKCTFEAAKLKGTFAPGSPGKPAPVELTITKQKFKHNKKAPNQTALCPSEGVYSGTFPTTANGKQLESDVF